MKNIDIKSLIIGALLTSTIFLGVAAVGPEKGESWKNSVWITSADTAAADTTGTKGGWEPFGYHHGRGFVYKKRIR